MTRDQHLEYCSICNKQKFDVQQGIICSLTNKIADFEESCDSFEENAGYKETRDKKNREANVMARQVSLGVRFTHAIIDGVIIILLAWGLVWLIRQSVSLYTWYRIPIMYLNLGFLGLSIAYYTFLEALTGKTIAKILTKTKVVNQQGEKPAFMVFLIRTIIRVLPFEPLSFFNSEALGWHDKMTETMVIYDK